MPSVQVVKGAGTDEIATIRVRYYSYELDEANPANSRYVLAPLRVIRAFTPKVTIYANNSGDNNAPRVTASANIDLRTLPDDATFIELAHPDLRKFMYATAGTAIPSGKEKLWSLVMSYEMFGNSYRVALRCDHGVAGNDVNCEN